MEKDKKAGLKPLYTLIYGLFRFVVIIPQGYTFATMAMQSGVDVKTRSSMLGHYDAGFALRIYTHATRQAQDAAAITMGEVMSQVV